MKYTRVIAAGVFYLLFSMKTDYIFLGGLKY